MKKKTHINETIYSISVEDIQTVANQEFGRDLNFEEIELIKDKIGDYFDWYERILSAINNNLIEDETSENGEL